MGFELDLFSADSTNPSVGAFSVSMVTSRARQLIEAGFRRIWVKGEIANFKAYRSGHWYFSLRDESAQVRCVMWRDDNRRVQGPPEEGTEVFIESRPTLWEERGEFRLTARRMIPTAAVGVWDVQFQKARAALERDGLLDPARKRSLPAYPSRLAVVTSPDGAALRDIIAVLRRRWPNCELLVVPTRVQGDGAESEICRALRRVNQLARIDLAIVGRGGGSREDLWAFNTEAVARAVAAVRVPTISAVGHETDVTLTDLVADVRAATPSAAAETAVPDREDAARVINALARRLGHTLASRAQFGRERLGRTADRLTAAIQLHLDRRRGQLAEVGAKLDALSPLSVLERGFAVARDDTGRVLKSVAQFDPEMAFRLTVADGDVSATVAPREGQ